MTDSAIYEYACEVYKLMEERSSVNELEEKLYRGFLTHLFKEVGASTTYYTHIRKLLDSPHHDPCILIYRRGSKNHPSIVRLMHPPPSEWGGISRSDLTPPGLSATMQEQVRKLLAWRESIEQEVSIVKRLESIERRLSKLERR